MASIAGAAVALAMNSSASGNRNFLLSFMRICVASVFCCAVLAGCSDGPRKRPVGVFWLGDYRQFVEPYTYRPDAELMVFKDAGGLSFMSTECTYDLALLNFVTDAAGQPQFTSNFSTSRYSLRGEVLSGPSKFRLPFYKGRLDEDVLGGPKISVYIDVPGEVSESWRLPVPSIP